MLCPESGVGFKTPLILFRPVQTPWPGAQYPIGDAEQCSKIVDNLAAVVKELDRTFVPDDGAQPDLAGVAQARQLKMHSGLKKNSIH